MDEKPKEPKVDPIKEFKDREQELLSQRNELQDTIKTYRGLKSPGSSVALRDLRKQLWNAQKALQAHKVGEGYYEAVEERDHPKPKPKPKEEPKKEEPKPEELKKEEPVEELPVDLEEDDDDDDEE